MSRFKPAYRNVFCVLLSSTLLLACSDEDVVSPQDSGTADALGQVDTAPRPDAAPVTPKPDAGGDVLASDGGVDAMVVPAAFVPKGLIVMHQADFNSSSFTITDLTGTNRMDDCIHSGSSSAGLTTALGGNMLLSANHFPTGEVALIDSGSEVITFLDPSNCKVNRQIKVGPGEKLSPQAIAWVATDRAYVVRQTINPTPTPSKEDFDEGGDLLVINPLTGSRLGRIDMAPWAIPKDDPKFWARPHHIVTLGDKAYVTLNNLSDTATQVGGDGRIVVVDTLTNKVEGTIELPGLKNCGALEVVGPQTLSVACGGHYASTRAVQTAQSAVVLVDVATKSVSKKIAASEAGGPFLIFSLAAKDDRFFAIVPGDYVDTNIPPDRIWTGLFSSGAPTGSFGGTNTGDLGGILVHPTLPKLYLSDKTLNAQGLPRIRVFNIENAPALTEEASLIVSATKKIPVISIAWF